MASYKVAQDVEAEDKLLGPFSFRQFIYLVIAVMAGVVAYGLSRLFLPLMIIPMPIVLFFLVLALPLRKDQPMEIYLAAIVSFYIKPRKRLWVPDGIQSLVEITVPPSTDVRRTKDLSENEAERRLAYLATLADTQGWSIRNATMPIVENNSMVRDVYNEAQQYQDVFDESGDVARRFEDRINKADAARRQAMLAGMQQATAAQQQPMAATPAQPPVAATPQDPTLLFNPYPTSMRQSIISPSGSAPKTPAPQPAAQQANTPTPVTAQPSTTPTPEPVEPEPQADQAATNKSEPTNTSDNSVSPDIINLASNTDLSIDTLAREAHRIEEKKSHHDDGEVVISLR